MPAKTYRSRINTPPIPLATFEEERALKAISDEELLEADHALYRRQGTAKTVIGTAKGKVVSKGGAFDAKDLFVSRDQTRAEKTRRRLR